jgi:L-rhamnose isomerase
VGSAEFTLSYAARKGIMPLMDNGHYHPTEVVSDKISALLQFNSRIGLHITRSVRWDSDHVVRLDDETREIAKEIVASGRIDDFAIALDYFDASINRVAAWTVGARSVRKALLDALLMPHAAWRELLDAGRMTELMVAQEEWKTMPFGAIWAEYCRRAGVAQDGEWLPAVLQYEKDVLLKR